MVSLRLHRTIQSLVKVGHLQKILTSRFSSEATAPGLPVVTLYTKDDCQLCEEAKHALTPISHRFQLEEVDITQPENKEWMKYRYDIPVFHFNGKFMMKHRVNFKDFEQLLTEYEEVHGRR